MKIQNLAGIIGSKLLNEPLISSIEGFCFEAHKAKRGECFFATNELEARLAVRQGAYAIVGDITPFDDEVAFLYSDDLDLAYSKLLRFFISHNNILLVLANRLQMALFSCISADVILLNKDKKANLEALICASSGSIAFLADSKSARLSSFKSEVLGRDLSIKNLCASLFYSDFIFDGAKYSLGLSEIFLADFAGILSFLRQKNIDFKLKDFHSFRPLFVGANNKPTASSRAFICINDKEIWEFAKNALKDLPAFAPKELNAGVNGVNFADLSELKSLSFDRYALVFCQYQELFDCLNESKEKQDELF